LFVAGIFFFLIIRSEGDILALLAQSRDSVLLSRDIIFELICVASTTHAPLMTHVEFTVRNDRAEIGFDLVALCSCPYYRSKIAGCKGNPQKSDRPKWLVHKDLRAARPRPAKMAG